MSERFFRIILGAGLLLALALKTPTAVYALIALLLFEGITNWRIPILISRIRYGDRSAQADSGSCCNTRFSFEAERGLRFIVAAIVAVSFIIYPELLWFMPWFVGFMLLSAGLTNLCPMVMFMRWAGLR